MARLTPKRGIRETRSTTRVFQLGLALGLALFALVVVCWQPLLRGLAHAWIVEETFTTADALARYAPYLAADVWHRVRATVPSGARLRADLSASTGADREPGPNRAPAPALTGAAAWARARYVAACAFGTWSAYDGWGVRSQLAELFVAAGVFEAECAHAADRHRRALDDALILEAVQQSDLLLRHLTDRAALCAWYHEVEWEV